MTGSTSHLATPTAVAKPASAIPPGLYAAPGTVAVIILPGSRDVFVDIELQNQVDLESVQFRSATLNAFVPAHYIQFTYNVTPHGGGTVSTLAGNVIYLVPEPTSLGLIAFAAAGLLGRQRRRPIRDTVCPQAARNRVGR